MLEKNELLKIKDKKKIEGNQCITATLTKDILCIYIYKNEELKQSVFIEPTKRLVYNHKTGTWSTNKIKTDISYINLEINSKNVLDKYLYKLNISDTNYLGELPYTLLLNKISATDFTKPNNNDIADIFSIKTKISNKHILNKAKNILPAKIIVHNKNKCFCTKCGSSFEMNLKTRKKAICPKCNKQATTLPLLPYVKNTTFGSKVYTTFTNRSYKEMDIVTVVKYINDTDIILLEYTAFVNYIVNTDDINDKPLDECITKNIYTRLKKAIVFRQYHSKKIYNVGWNEDHTRQSKYNFTTVPHNQMTGASAYTQIYLAYDIEHKNELVKLKNFRPTCYDFNTQLVDSLELLDMNTDKLTPISEISPKLYEYIAHQYLYQKDVENFKLITNILNLNGKSKKEVLKLQHMKIKDVNKLIELLESKLSTAQITAIIKLYQQKLISPEWIPMIKDIFRHLKVDQKYSITSYYKYITEPNKKYEKRLMTAVLDTNKKFIIKNNNKTLDVLESLIKIGKKDLVADLLFYRNNISFNKSTELLKALGITKKQLETTQNYEDLIWNKFNYDNKLRYDNDMINSLLKPYIGTPDIAIEITNLTSMSIKQLTNYAFTLRKQDVDAKTYLSYLKKCAELKKQITSNTINRPKDINAAIRQINSQYDIANNPILKQIRETTDAAELKETFDSLKLYEYSDPKYMIIPPSKPEDIIAEGTALNHCVAKTPMYLNRIYNHESYIMFLRKADSGDKPWYTLEVEPGGIIRQKRTKFDNINKDFDDAMPFLKEWQKHIENLTKDAFPNEIEESKAKRIQNLNTLRYEKKTVMINGEVHLLADVLENDLIQI